MKLQNMKLQNMKMQDRKMQRQELPVMYLFIFEQGSNKKIHLKN